MLEAMETTQKTPASLSEVVRPTTIIKSSRLSKHLGIEITLASETFQHTGSFKFRAAYNVASHVPQTKILTASSGNFGQAMAYACQLLGKSCIIVMPHTSARVKIDAVREFGGTVDLTDVMVKGRNARVAELALEHSDAYIASAFDDPLVIAGNASLGEELAVLSTRFRYHHCSGRRRRFNVRVDYRNSRRRNYDESHWRRAVDGKRRSSLIARRSYH